MYDFMKTEIPGFHVVFRGQEFVGEAFKRPKGVWTFQPSGHDAALLKSFKTKRAIAEYVESGRK